MHQNNQTTKSSRIPVQHQADGCKTNQPSAKMVTEPVQNEASRRGSGHFLNMSLRFSPVPSVSKWGAPLATIVSNMYCYVNLTYKASAVMRLFVSVTTGVSSSPFATLTRVSGARAVVRFATISFTCATCVLVSRCHVRKV